MAAEPPVGPVREGFPEPAPPTSRDEAWRYSPATDLVRGLESALPSERVLDVDLETILGCLAHRSPRLVFVDGVFEPRASRLRPRGRASMHPVARRHRWSEEHDIAADWFEVRNERAPDDAALIAIETGTAVPTPLHVVHVTQHGGHHPVASHPRTIIRVEAGGSVDVVESFCSASGPGATNAVTLLQVGDGAQLRYHRIQDEHDAGTHTGLVRASLGADSSTYVNSLTLGAAASRVAIDVGLVEEAGAFDLDALYVISGDQHHDHVVTVEHAASATISNQRVRGMVDDRARGGFTGHVIVPAGVGAVEVDQSSRALLLAPHAQVDARPWLEILADDVRATHGAAIGRLDDEALFYLRSRGVPEDRARRILLRAFADEMTSGISDGWVREHAAGLVSARLDRSAPEASR